jgi:hypothetical protein
MPYAHLPCRATFPTSIHARLFRARLSRSVCERIGHLVIDARNNRESFVLRFDDDSLIETPKFSPGAGPEIAHFPPTKNGKRDLDNAEFFENVTPTRPET